MAGRKAETPMLNPVLNEKATAELSVLNSKLHDKLKQDITRIYSDSLFPDLNLLFHSCCIKTHKGLLETRAPKFYKEICNRGAINKQTAKQRRPFIDRLTVRLIESFIREVYTRNVVKHKEDAVVAQIKIVSSSGKEVESPDSDVFVTPKASPCEPIPNTRQTALTPPASKRNESNIDELIKRNHYYNLVHVEEDLFKELAEQDALSNSFRSILEKQEQERTNPTVLDFTSTVCEQEQSEYKVQSLTEERAKTLKILNKQHTYTIENEMNGGRETKEEEVSFEAVSSGYMTGGSPKDTREDVTEVASNEEIPHDDRSPSSASSDQGTWDSTFPTNNDNTFIEREVELKVEPLKTQAESLANKDVQVTGSQEKLVKGNYFIDASTLRDEDETYITSFDYIPPQTSTKQMEPKTNEIIEVSIENSTNYIKADLDLGNDHEQENFKVENKFEQEIRMNFNDVSDNGEIKYKEEDVGIPDEDETLKNRKIIRRNTFELDPDDDKLAMLKEEYERVNGFKKTEDVHNTNDTKAQDFTQNIMSAMQKIEEDHSPDSLNCDFPYESFSVDAPKEELEQQANENVKTSSPLRTDQPQQILLNMSGFSDLSNSSEPNSSLSVSGVSSKREAETTEDTNSSAKNDKTDTYQEMFPIMPSNTQTQMSDLSASSDYSLTASPLMSRRRNEFAPILSGGCDIVPEVKKPKPRSSNSMNTSWIVDMSDSGKSPPDSANKVKEKQRNSNSGTGFFVPLEDPFPSIDSVTSNSSERSDSMALKRERNSSCGFYIDLKNDSDSENGLKKFKEQDTPQPEKKLFSIFIDIGNGKDNTPPKSKPGSPFLPHKRKAPNYIDRISAKTLDKKSTSTSSDSGLDCGEHPEITKGKTLFDSSLDHGPQSISDSSTNDSAFSTKRQSFFMFIEADESPVPRRRTLPSGMKHSTNRHSWNSEKKASGEVSSDREHKRSSSISYDGNLRLDLDEQYKSGPVSIDEHSSGHRKSKMTSSWHCQVKASNELCRIIQNGAKHEFRECKARKSLENHSDCESVDKVEDMCSSIKSEEPFTDISGSSKDRTFIIDDVSKVVNVNTNDLELSTPSHDIISDLSKDDTETDPAIDIRSSGSNEELTPKQDHFSSQPQIVEDTNSNSVGFVKLSDMDNQPDPSRMWKSQEVRSSRMTRSIPEGNWLETKMMANSASSRSLSRLFPHLYPGRTYEGGSDTDFSNHSSMQSSINPSPLELSTEGTEGSCASGGPCSRLGEDLLRMFLDEISPDVTVDVGGRRIKAHKCILSSRCQYFAGMLSGGWVESAGNVISLQGFSYNAVHFALCHIYSGASNIPETINIVELATLADMLCLEGLKEVIMYTLKVKYCHFFHKPCNSNSCISGVLECLPLAAAYGLDEIYRKSLRWITKYFVRVWPTKGFANLPKELQDKCYKQHIVHLSAENVLETIMGCEKLEATVTNVKWAQTVINMNLKLHEASVKYLTQHFADVLSSEAFIRIGKEDVWTMTRLEETLLSISRTLSPDQSCQSYKKIKNLLASIRRDEEMEINWRMEFLDLLTQLESSVEDCLVRQAGRAARTASWAQMDLALRKKIQEMACLVFTPGPRSSSATKCLEGRSPRLGERNTASRPSSERGQRSLGNTPILGRSKVPPPSSTNTKRPTTSVTKTAQLAGQPKGPTVRGPQRSASVTNASAASLQQNKTSGVPRPKISSKLSHVKSRYLEPKSNKKETTETPVSQIARPVSGVRRLSGGGKVISSSDSSRTSSPATSRVSRPPTKPKTPVLGTGSRIAKSNPGGGDSSKRESSDGSGGNPSPSLATNQVKRTSTFRVATKSSAAKAAQPRNVNQNSVNNSQRQITQPGRSGTFLKDSPTVTKRIQLNRQQ
ncbi:uncharacterized protein LOC106661480 isoform X2 [Cimex lectularius]|uniref:BTB domain-containing protein n=1 Tax=Cimex lectularius TaxID=79782 RepID=A0A8I6SFG5_CIMLE|nr:uncharacterized protein LOC106661480 isoform X2 [Cimex lectularius]